MLDFLLVLIFSGHLLLVDVAIAGPLFCVWLDWRARRNGDDAAAAIGRRLAAWAVFATSLGIAAGLGLWQIVEHLPGQERYLRVFNAIPASRWWGIVSELAFYLVVMGVYWATWNRWRLEKWRRWRWLHGALAIVAVTTLAFHFPPLFARVSAISTRPEVAEKLADGEEFRTRYIFQDAETMARTAHHLLASLAVVGIVVAGMAAQSSVPLLDRRQMDEQSTKTLPGVGQAVPHAVRQIGIAAARMSLLATLLQLPVGVWVMLQLPSPARDQILGGDPFGMAIFLAALVCVLGLLHHLAALALGDLTCRKVYVTGVILILTTLLMTGMLHRTRTDVYRQLDVLQKPTATP